MIDGSKIQALREQANLTQTEFGKIIGAEQSMIGYIEREVKRPSVELLARIADYFNVTMDYLLKKGTTAEKQFAKDSSCEKKIFEDLLQNGLVKEIARQVEITLKNETTKRPSGLDMLWQDMIELGLGDESGLNVALEFLANNAEMLKKHINKHSAVDYQKVYIHMTTFFVTHLILIGHWDKNNLTREQVEKFGDDFAAFAKSRGESGTQLIRTFGYYLDTLK